MAHEVDYTHTHTHTHTVPRLSMSGFILHSPISLDGVHMGIYRKPTYIDITIHFTSNHPFHQKLAKLLYQQNDCNAHHRTSEKMGMEQDNHYGPKQWSP